jgi:hypothetical protein
MSKRNRQSDNSKRQQPIQQQRAQARQNLPGTSRKAQEAKPQSGGADHPQGTARSG